MRAWVFVALFVSTTAAAQTPGVELSGKVVARGGLFQTWVDPEALVADTAREFVDRPIESRGVRATEGYQTPGLPPGRSIGAAIRLDPDTPAAAPRVGFELAVQ